MGSLYVRSSMGSFVHLRQGTCLMLLGTIIAAAVSAATTPANARLAAGNLTQDLDRAPPVTRVSLSARAVDIPTGPLDQALILLSQQLGVRISFNSDTVAGRTTGGLRGQLTAEAALRRLISDTNLRLESAGPTSFIVLPPRVTVAQAPDEPGAITLGEITVFGERVERDVFETPSSLYVVTGEELDDRPGVKNYEDAVQDIPNVVNFGSSNFIPAIRGQNSNGPLLGAGALLINGILPRLTVSVDGRPLSPGELQYSNASVWDLSGIEVFRGPQTTSQGLNAIAGAIYMRTSDPTYFTDMSAQGQVSSFDGTRGSAMLNVPIVQNELAVRGTIDYVARDSYVDNVTPGLITNGVDAESIYQISGRVKVLWEPDEIDGFSNKVTLNFTDGKSPQREFADQPFKAREQIFNPDAVSFETGANVIINDTRYDISEQFSLKNQFSYSDYRLNRIASDPGEGTLDTDGEDIINETIASVNLFDGRLTGILGAVYRETVEDVFLDGSTFFGSTNTFDDEKNNLGVFSELTFQVTDKLYVTGGLRYQRDRQRRTMTPGPVLPALDFDGTFEAWLPRVVVGYDITDNVRIGALVSKGYNPGGVNIDFTSIFLGLPSPPFKEYDKETLWNYEIFARARLLDSKLHINANAFFADFKDVQRVTTTSIGLFQTTIIDNAEDAMSYGLEVSADYQVTDTFRLFGGLGLLETEIEEFSSDELGREGKDFEFAPAVTASVGFDWEFVPNVTFGMRARYNDGYFSDDTNRRETEVPAYTVVDVRLDYQPNERFKVFGFVNNLFDEDYVTNIQLPGTGPTGDVGKPLEIGVGIMIALGGS